MKYVVSSTGARKPASLTNICQLVGQIQSVVDAHNDMGSNMVNITRGTVGKTAVIFGSLGDVALDNSYKLLSKSFVWNQLTPEMMFLLFKRRCRIRETLHMTLHQGN